MVFHLGFPYLSSGFVLKIITFLVRSCKLPLLAIPCLVPTFTFTKLRHFRQPITHVAGDVMFYFCMYAYSNKVEMLLYVILNEKCTVLQPLPQSLFPLSNSGLWVLTAREKSSKDEAHSCLTSSFYPPFFNELNFEREVELGWRLNEALLTNRSNLKDCKRK